ncbi:2TM domain-containing protein [Flavobacterium phycosphaerae]|uniref:2TM domain-containing protein n=1 Tax=Flavobacterium phycosphaerae TaxID=2697515 RepID=UPI0013899413|nr:2TM domain-containing protein [Flavobacterium phycosphaerae]
MQHQDEIKYLEAAKRVKKIKGFYTHALVYVVINTAIILSKIDYHEDGSWSFELSHFSTALFWGIGLAAHGLSVFMPGMLLGKNWEEKKINELMEKEKNNKWE